MTDLPWSRPRISRSTLFTNAEGRALWAEVERLQGALSAQTERQAAELLKAQAERDHYLAALRDVVAAVGMSSVKRHAADECERIAREALDGRRS